ncbi:MAG: GH3 auxin-responsive promoter family protein [Psychroflexus sp.]|nr:GH3 auxin-responsive promoter family protein [Psychroflexus sp.]
MAIKGSLIKNIINVTDRISTESNPVEEQEKVLRELLEKAKDTAFGKYYGFTKILESDHIKKTYSKKVPYFDYNQMNTKWWHRLHEGEEDISWPGSPFYYAISSGTTGKTSKKIPITEDMLDAIKLAGIKQVTALANFDLPSDFFEKEIMMLGSSTNLDNKGDHLEGEISGISASNIPFWFRGYYKPGEEIAKIEDWDERVKHIAENAKKWDIGALSGIPSWMELMLKEVINYHQVDTIHDIWPNLQVYTSGGVAFKPYEKSFNALLKHPITVIDTYLASEGFIACQTRPETSAMQLITDNGIYFEFVPFEPQYIQQDGSITEKAPVVSFADVEEGKDYVLLMSTVSGAWRYLIGDTIAFTDKKRAEIKITGRTKFFLNVVGSQLSVNKMNDAIQELENKFDIKLPEFTVSAVKIDNKFYHIWHLGSTDTSDINVEDLASALDDILKEANKNYRVARSKALKGIKVKLLPLTIFHEWCSANKKKGGQVKMEKVMNEEKYSELDAFIKKQLS